MAEITLKEIKELRNRTGVGINHVKEALNASNGDVDKAILYLREKGIAKAAKRAGNATNHGFIGSYIHGKTIGVMVELESETDFASGSAKFQELAKELAMHIAAQSPIYVDRGSVPAEIIETEKKVFAKAVEGKPEAVAAKITEGKLNDFYAQNVLLDQVYVRDESKKIMDLMNDAVAALGEKIIIRKFVRMQLGLDPIVASLAVVEEE